MKLNSMILKRILLVGFIIGPILGVPLHDASAGFPCLTAPLSKLTAERNSNGADFQIKMINGCGTTNKYVIFPLTLSLGIQNGPISSTSVNFYGIYQTDVRFHFSNEQLIGLSTIKLRPTIQSGTQIMDLGNFVFHFLSLEISDQKITLDKNPLSQSAILEVSLNDPFYNQHSQFIWDTVVEISDRKTYMEVTSNGQGDIYISGTVGGESKAVTPTLRLFDKDGNSVVFTLKRFTANSLAWTKNLKTCASGLQIKTQCDEFPGVSFEFCSPLEDYKISEFDGKKWISPNERFQGEKDLDRCKSTKPFYIYYSAANESLTKVNKVRFIFYATPTQKAQTWEIQIKTVKKK